MTHNICSALHIGLNIVQRMQALLLVLHTLSLHYTIEAERWILLLVSHSHNPKQSERTQDKGSNRKSFDFSSIRTFLRSNLYPVSFQIVWGSGYGWPIIKPISLLLLYNANKVCAGVIESVPFVQYWVQYVGQSRYSESFSWWAFFN